jgi:hypothetical protein
MTPGEYDALKSVWEDGREYDNRRHAELMAALYNVAIQKGFKPPHGEVWEPAMFLPDYHAPDKPKDEWQGTKRGFELLAAISKYRSRPVEEKRAHKRAVKEAQRVLAERRRKAQQMREAGEPAEKIRAMLKGLPYG